MSTQKSIPIVLITDENYVIPTSVAIQSLIENRAEGTELEINLMARNLSKNSRRLLEAYRQRGVAVTITDMVDESISRFDEEGYYVSSTGLLKFAIAETFRQYDKILYIDGDIIVRGDISKLFELNIEDYYVAAIPDMAAVDACHFDEKLAVDNYFNSGVMLLNTKRIRSEHLTEKLWETKREHPEYQCMDQDVFNDVFRGRVLFLPPKYNLMLYNALIGGFTMERINEFYDTSYGSLAEMDQDAVIVHLTNERKPWKYRNGYKVEEWAAYYERTSFGKEGIPIPYVDEESFADDRKRSVIRKERIGSNTVVSFFSVPIVELRRGGFWKTYCLFGIPCLIRPDSGYFEHRLNVYKDAILVHLRRLGTSLGSAESELICNEYGSEDEQMDLYRQLMRLEGMGRSDEITF